MNPSVNEWFMVGGLKAIKGWGTFCSIMREFLISYQKLAISNRF